MGARAKLLPWSVRLAGGAALVVLGSVARVEVAAAGRVHDRVEDVPEAPVGLVLGTAPTLADGRENLFFRYRMDAAAELFHAGRVRALLVSGDHGSATYDEPSAMRDALVRRGVPADRIVLDHAGFRTLDSVIRARRVFGAARVVIVSQRFHDARALYLADAFGLEAVGFAARSPRFADKSSTWLREPVARVAAVLEATFGGRPRFFGPRERLPG